MVSSPEVAPEISAKTIFEDFAKRPKARRLRYNFDYTLFEEVYRKFFLKFLQRLYREFRIPVIPFRIPLFWYFSGNYFAIPPAIYSAITSKIYSVISFGIASDFFFETFLSNSAGCVFIKSSGNSFGNFYQEFFGGNLLKQSFSNSFVNSFCNLYEKSLENFS